MFTFIANCSHIFPIVHIGHGVGDGVDDGEELPGVWHDLLPTTPTPPSSAAAVVVCSIQLRPNSMIEFSFMSELEQLQ